MRDSVTKLDHADGTDWAIEDSVVRFREWGTERVHNLPANDVGSWGIGRSNTAWLQLRDPDRLVSRRHAELLREPDGWVVRDVGSKNGLWLDDERRDSFPLVAGTEIGVGSVRLVAESRRLISVRALVARLIGWRLTRRTDVDFALRSLREMATLKSPLLLCGDGDLAVVAHQLHRALVGVDRPFVVCDPRRRRVERSARTHGNEPDAPQAIGSASGGTLCVWARYLPAGFAALARTLRDPGRRVRLILFTDALDHQSSIPTTTVALPALSTRSDEIARIVDEYAADAMEHFGATGRSFTVADRDRIAARRPTSLAVIAHATARLVAIGHFGGVTRAAPHLSRSHVALSRWLARFRDGGERG